MLNTPAGHPRLEEPSYTVPPVEAKVLVYMAGLPFPVKGETAHRRPRFSAQRQRDDLQQLVCTRGRQHYNYNSTE